MHSLNQIEIGALMFIQEHIRCQALNGLMRFITTLGNAGVIWIALTLVFLALKRCRRSGLAMTFALLIGLVLTNIALKNIIHRIRPYDFMESLKILVNPEHDFSFPSGHATSSFAAAWALWRTASRKLGLPALILAILIALSRLYVGVHYPTDVLFGALIGMFAGEIGARTANRIPERT